MRRLALKRLAAELRLPGFRRGSVPLELAAKRIDPGLLRQQTLEDAVNWSFNKAAGLAGLTPLDQPDIDVKSYGDDSLVFVASLQILPPVKLGDYHNLGARRPEVSVSAQEVGQVIHQLRLARADKTVTKQPARQGDEVWIDFVGYDAGGRAVQGASGQDYPLTLGGQTFIDGFEEALLGKKAGDQLELKLTFPADYHQQALRSKKVTFKISVKTVKRVNLPALDDAFAEAVAGRPVSLKTLKADIKRELASQKQRQSDDDFRDRLVERLVAVSQVPVPDVLVKDQVDFIERDTLQNLTRRGLTLEGYLQAQGLSREQWREGELKEAAARRVQAGLALAELSKVERVEVSKEELETRYDEFLARYGDAKARARLDSDRSRRDFANHLLSEKTIDRLVELNSSGTH